MNKIFYAGLLISLLCNFAVFGVTIWDNATSTDADLFISNGLAATWFLSTLIAVGIGLPLNIIALRKALEQNNTLKMGFAGMGILLSLTPYFVPSLTS